MFVFLLNNFLLGVGLAMDAFSVSIANGLAEPHMRRSKMCGVAGTYAIYQFAMPMIGWFCVRTAAERFETFQKLIPWIALGLLLYIGGKMVIEGIRSHTAGDREVAAEAAALTAAGGSTAAACSGAAAGSTAAACSASAGGSTAAACSGAAGGSAAAACSASATGRTAVCSEPAADAIRTLGFGTLMLQGIATSIDALSVGFTIADQALLAATAGCLIIAGVTFVICMSGLIFGKKFGERLADKATILGGLILIGIGVEIWVKGVFF